MSKVSVRLRVNTKGAKSGSVVELEADQAAYLIENGHALAVAPAKKAAKSDKD